MNGRPTGTLSARYLQWYKGFTLIELLVVVAIITLLIGILIPSLSAAKDQARRGKDRAMLKGVGDCLEAWVGENDREQRGQDYPRSTAGDDPTEVGDNIGDDSEMFGAHLLVRYLMGKELDGYIAEHATSRGLWGDQGASGNPGERQLYWYEGGGPDGLADPLQRTGTYLPPESVEIMRTEELQGRPAGGGALDPFTAELPVIVDTYRRPVLYYAANTRQAKRQGASLATRGAAGDFHGIYNFGDNALFTGGVASGGSTNLETWDFGNGVTQRIDFPWTGATAPDWGNIIENEPNSFAYFIMNKNVFRSTPETKRSVVPVRKDSYILWTPGKDGLFGTSDDVTNF